MVTATRQIPLEHIGESRYAVLVHRVVMVVVGFLEKPFTEQSSEFGGRTDRRNSMCVGQPSCQPDACEVLQASPAVRRWYPFMTAESLVPQSNRNLVATASVVRARTTTA
jgi:hypothetical protein